MKKQIECEHNNVVFHRSWPYPNRYVWRECMDCNKTFDTHPDDPIDLYDKMIDDRLTEWEIYTLNDDEQCVE